MAAPEDLVRLLKVESPGDGGTDDDEGFQANLDPNEDAPSVRGIFVQGPSGEDKLVYLTRDASGNLVFRDDVTGVEYTLSQLLGAAATPTEVGQVLYSIDGSSFTVQTPLTEYDGGWLINDGGDLLVTG